MTFPTDPVAWAVKAFQDGRDDTISMYDEYLSGKQPIAFATVSFRETFGKLFDSFAYNRLSSVIDAHSDRMQVSGIGANDKTLATLAQQQWDANQMDVRENEATSDALGFGDGFLIVERHAVTGQVYYWVNDPRQIRVHYSDDRPGHLDLAAKAWLDTESKHGFLTLYFADHVEKYVTRHEQSGSSLNIRSAEWTKLERSGEDQSYSLEIADTVPVFHLANNARTSSYGVSEIKLLIPLQDAINYVLMSSMVATEFSAFAQKVIMGVKPESEEEAQQFKEFQVGIRRLLTLFDENAKIGEFSPTNIAQYIDLAEFWDTTVSRISRVPVHYLKQTGTQESGEAKRLNEQPFISKIIDRQRSFGYTYGEAVRYGLRLAGKNVEPGDIRINWQDAAPSSDQETWELIRLKQSAGMSFESAVREAGYEPDQIALLLSERDADQERRLRAFGAGDIDAFPGSGRMA